jgi:hypothetical protein
MDGKGVASLPDAQQMDIFLEFSKEFHQDFLLEF